MASSSTHPSRPQVLLVSRKWPPAIGGMETYSVELARSLRESFDIDTLVLPGKPNGDTPGMLDYGRFVLKAMLHLLFNGRRYTNVVFTDLLLFPAAVMHRLVAPKHRRIVVVHGLDLVFQRRPGLLSRAYGGFLAAFRANQGAFATIVANSRNTAALARDAGLRNVTVITPCLPHAQAVAQAPAMADLPAEWRNAPRRVLYFGRMVPRKGAAWFAENVLPGLPDDVRFFVVGHAPDADYRDRVARCPRTHCLGRVDGVLLSTLIASADVVVMPNVATPEAIDVEGFGIAAIETSAQGGILLASAIDGIIDAVIDGVTGTLVAPGDSQRWIEATSNAIARAPADRVARRDVAASATRVHYSHQVQASAFARLLDTADD